MKAKSAVVRQQLKWVVWGSLLAITPFTILYAVGYLLGAETDPWLIDTAVLPLVLIPLASATCDSLSPMDVELVVRRVLSTLNHARDCDADGAVFTSAASTPLAERVSLPVN